MRQPDVAVGIDMNATRPFDQGFIRWQICLKITRRGKDGDLTSRRISCPVPCPWRGVMGIMVPVEGPGSYVPAVQHFGTAARLVV